MKKLILGLSVCLLLVGCSSKTETTNQYTSEEVTNHSIDEDQVDPTILRLISQCIEDYNTNAIAERSSELTYEIPPLPICLPSIPPVDSLDQLERVTDVEGSNVQYAYQYVLDSVTVLFRFYNFAASFWTSGDITFVANENILIEDNPEYAETKETLDSLLANYVDVLSWLSGSGLSLSETESTTHPGYSAVLSMGSAHPSTIQEVKDIAERVFTFDFLSSTYASAFDSSTPLFIEEGGQLLCASTVASTNLPVDFIYDTHYIVGVRDNEDGTRDVDLVKNYDGELVPEITRVTLVQTEQGWRISHFYN